MLFPHLTLEDLFSRFASGSPVCTIFDPDVEERLNKENPSIQREYKIGAKRAGRPFRVVGFSLGNKANRFSSAFTDNKQYVVAKFDNSIYSDEYLDTYTHTFVDYTNEVKEHFARIARENTAKLEREKREERALKEAKISQLTNLFRQARIDPFCLEQMSHPTFYCEGSYDDPATGYPIFFNPLTHEVTLVCKKDSEDHWEDCEITTVKLDSLIHCLKK